MAETTPGATYAKEKKRRECASIDAVDPHDRGMWNVLLANDKMTFIAKQGMGAALELADTVRWSLRYPRHLYRGVRDDERDVDDDGWLCYVATPSHAYNWRNGVKCPAWENQVFCVYVTEERLVYHWFWVACDPDNPFLPFDHEARFTVKVF